MAHNNTIEFPKNNLTDGENSQQYSKETMFELFEKASGEDKARAATAYKEIRQALKYGKDGFRAFVIQAGDGLVVLDMNLGDIEMSLDNPTLRIYCSSEDANEALMGLPEDVRKACYVSVLGMQGGIDPLVDIWRCGVKYLKLDDLVVEAGPLTQEVRNLGSSYFAVAPQVFAALSGVMTCMLYRDNEAADYARRVAAVAAAQGCLGVILKKEDVSTNSFNPRTVDVGGVKYIAAFTDWLSWRRAEPMNQDNMNLASWDKIVSVRMPVAINNFIYINVETAMELQMLSLRGRMAKLLICANLGISSDSRASTIFQDIQKADGDLCNEFLSGVVYNDKTDSISFLFPAREEAMRVDGYTAQDLFESGVCKTPSAAYHVLALLAIEKNPDGPTHKAFEEGLLYD